MIRATSIFTPAVSLVTALSVFGAEPDLAAPDQEAPPAKPFLVSSVEEAKSLPEGTDSVEVNYVYGLRKGGRFVALMKVLAANPGIRHLRLELPNSSHVTNTDLEVLREFKTLESFDLEDDRDFGGDEILNQTMAMPQLRKVTFEFG